MAAFCRWPMVEVWRWLAGEAAVILVAIVVLGGRVDAQAAGKVPVPSASPGSGTIAVIPGPRPADADFGPWTDPVIERIGWQLVQAVEELGGPQEVAVVRGTEPRLDAVVFYYPDHSYLYWWGNRLWQLRFDGRYRGEVLSLEMGITRAEVLKRLGNPAFPGTDDMVYQLPDRGFPVRLRLIFQNGRLNDLYLYRADF